MAAPDITQMRRYLAGMEPERLAQSSGQRIRIHPGSLVNAAGDEIASLTAPADIDFETVGVNGRDTGASLVEGGSYQIYCIQNDTSGELAFVASRAILGPAAGRPNNGTPPNGAPVIPAGWSYFRKMPGALVYKAGWGGLPEFYLSNWPRAAFVLTGVNSAAPYTVLVNGASTSFASVDLSEHAPDSARLVRLIVRATAVGTAGSAYLQSPGVDGDGILVASCNPVSGLYENNVVEIRTNSDRVVNYKVTGGCRLSLDFQGWTHTEPV
jgi:hypothetical protein